MSDGQIRARAGLEENLRLYQRHQLAAGAMFWGPTLFLFLVSEFGLRQALFLQAIYYGTVVVLEVPSGWMSDRVSRSMTLRFAAISSIGAHFLFLVGHGAVPIIAGQILLAAGYALLSGTDVTLHFDTLDALSRSEQFAAREAKSRGQLYRVTAVTSVVGGALAMIDLRLPFAAALLGAGLQGVFAWRLNEPPHTTPDDSFIHEISATVRSLRQPLLGWLMLYVAGQVVVVHLAAELVAPYLTDVLGAAPSDPGLAAFLIGLLAASVALVAAFTVGYLEPTVKRVGLPVTLAGLAAIPVVIVISMTVTSSIWILPLLSFRRVQGAANSVLLPALAGGHVQKHHRATFLSLTSLVGRLLYVGVLILLGLIGSTQLSETLALAAGIAIALWLVIAVSQRRVPHFPRLLSHGHSHLHRRLDHEHVHAHDDQHHDHDHGDPIEEPHSHHHRHEPLGHAHAHSRDIHHNHDHD